MRATSSATLGPGPASLNSGYGSRKRSIKSGAPFGRARGCFGGPVGVRDGRETPRLAAASRSCQGFTRTRNRADLNSALVPTSLVTPRMQDGIRGTSRRCGGGFAEQVARNIEKCEAPTLLREHLGIRLDENLDGLFAGINLDAKGRSPKSTSWRRPFSRRMMACGIVVSL
jgi:hypothetical protein